MGNENPLICVSPEKSLDFGQGRMRAGTLISSHRHSINAEKMTRRRERITPNGLSQTHLPGG
jgi:hypothetical protein